MAFAALTIDLNARLAKFETDMARAGKSLDSLNSRASAAAAGLKNAFGALGVGIGVGALAAFAKSGIDAADSLNDMSVRLGVSVKDLASFQLAAEQSGTSLEGIGKGIQKLTLSMGQAEQGLTTQAKALQTLGITARDPREAFFQLADAVANSNDPIKTNAALNDVLGRSYGELLPLLSQGSEALRKSARESENFADAMSRLAPDADKFNDQLASLKINAAGAASSLLSDLVPAINRVFDRFDAISRLRGSGASLFEIITGKVSADYKKTLDEANAGIAALEAKQQRLGQTRLGAGDQAELARLKAIRAEAQAIAVERINAPPTSASSGKAASNAGGIDLSAASKKSGGSKSDPQGAFVSKLRDEAATLGMGAEALQRYEALKLKLTGTNARLADGYIKQIAAFKDQQAAAEANNALADEEIKKREAIEAAQNNSIKSLREWIAEQEFEATLYGKTNAEREAAIQLRAVESTGVDMQTEAFKKMHDQLVAISETHALDSLISDTTIEKTRTLHENVAILDRALLDGKISTEQWNEAFDKFNGGKKIQELDTFAKTAAENIQNSFADFLFDPFDKGIKGMAQSFGDTIKHMIANAVAADLTKKLFGGLADNGKTSGDGWAGAALNMIGGLLKFDGGGYTGDGARAGGVDGKGGFLAVMHPRETVVDHTRGQSMGGHTVIVNVNGSNNAPDVRRAAGQGAREALGMISGAQRYA